MKKIMFLLGLSALLVLAFILPVSAGSKPDADFTSNTTEGTAPFTVLFIDQSSNTPTAWLWSFGDGGTSTIQNPYHTYTSDGTYTVTLTATNSEGSDTTIQTGYIKVTMVPVAAFVVNVTSGKAPLPVQFVDASTNSPDTWAWSFGDGKTSTAQNPSHTYTTSGTYTVTLTATNSAGSDTVSKTRHISVTEETESPIASFAVTSKTTGKAPLTVQFIDSSTNSPTSWAWSFGDGDSSTAQNPTHTYTTSGTYTVTLTVTNSADSDVVIEKEYITVEPSVPSISFVADKTSGSLPLTVHFTDTSTNSPDTWAWSFGDGGTSSDKDAVHTYTNSGTYTVKLTATNNEGSNDTTINNYITVTDAVVSPVVSFTSDVTEGSAPLTVHFTDTSTNSPETWIWSFGDGSTSTIQDPSHTYIESGSYTVKLNVSNAWGSNTITRSGYIVVTAVKEIPHQTSPVETAPTSSGAGTTAQMSEVSRDTSTPGSSGYLLYVGVAILVVIGILAAISARRHPRGPGRNGGGDL